MRRHVLYGWVVLAAVCILGHPAASWGQPAGRHAQSLVQDGQAPGADDWSQLVACDDGLAFQYLTCTSGSLNTNITLELPAGTQNIGDVDVVSSALPTGASTAANQTTGNTSLATIAGDTTSIDGKITACNTGAVTISAALPAGSNNVGDTDIEILGTAATVDTDSEGQAADFDIAGTADANLRLLGWTARESAGSPAAATVVIRRDQIATTCDGDAVAYIELNANQSATLGTYAGGRGLLIGTTGLCADVLAGTVDLNVWMTSEAAP